MMFCHDLLKCPARLAALICFVSASIWTTSSSADIIDIRVGQTDGPVNILFQDFIPNGHFGFPTLDLGEEIFNPMPGSGGNQVATWDLEIIVTRQHDRRGDYIIAVDKDVLNMTGFDWIEFQMTLGRGLGNNFVESDEFDFLYFRNDPPPIEETGAFDNPPQQDDPIAPDNLAWSGGTGVANGGQAEFWLAINVPDEFFNEAGVAVFTLRESASIPEPSAMGLIGLAAAAGCFLRRRRIS